MIRNPGQRLTYSEATTSFGLIIGRLSGSRGQVGPREVVVRDQGVACQSRGVWMLKIHRNIVNEAMCSVFCSLVSALGVTGLLSEVEAHRLNE